MVLPTAVPAAPAPRGSCGLIGEPAPGRARLERQKGSPKIGDTLHPLRHPGATGAAGKGDPRRPVINVFLAAPDSPFGTIIKGIPSIRSPAHSTTLSKLSPQRVLTGLQEAVGGMA